MSDYQAFFVEKTDNGFTRSIVARPLGELPEHDVLIDVHYSSVNYKDGLSATGNPGVTRNFPHTPGIDAAGLILEDRSGTYQVGDAVIVTGYDLGMGTAGGFGQRIRVPAAWVVPLPAGLTLQSAMTLGTAGLTAALCIDKLEQVGMTPASGPLLVTGATGGVGSVAVMLGAKIGYEVVAVTGKAEQESFLKSIGAASVLRREALQEGTNKPLLKETYGGVVDTVGGDILVNALKSLRYGASLAACGLVASPQVNATVLPFILRHVNLLGVDSVELPLAEKQRIWERLAGDWRLPELDSLAEPLALGELSDTLDRILAGQMVGRGVLRLYD